MNRGELVYWMYLLGGALVVVVSVVATWWGLFGDRSRGRRRCPKCWHNLDYTPGMTCGECGFTGKKEPVFYRTHRRWGWTVLGALTASLGIGYFIEEGLQRNWAGYLPTRVIILTLPLTDGSTGSLPTELQRRIVKQQLSNEHWESLLNRCIDGDGSAQPLTDEWEAKYGPILQYWRSNLASDAALVKRLRDIPPRVVIREPPETPNGMPVFFEAAVRDWWPNGAQARVHLTPNIPGARTVSFVRTDQFIPNNGYPFTTPPPAENAETVVFDVVVERRWPEMDESWEIVSEQSISIPVELRGTIDEHFEPVESDVLENAVRATFAAGAFKWKEGLSPVRIQINYPTTFISESEDVAFGVAVELLKDDVVARQLNVWWLGGVLPSGPARGYGYEIAIEDVPLLMTAASDDESWTMRVRGDAALALRAGGGSKYWNGEFTVPLRLTIARRPFRPKPWWSADAQRAVTEPQPRGDEL